MNLFSWRKGKAVNVSINQLCKWPFDEEAFRQYCDEWANGDKEYEAQLRYTWSQAWILVADLSGPADSFEAGLIGYPGKLGPKSNPDNWQAAWMEVVLHDSPMSSQIAFFIHEEHMTGSIFYGKAELSLPEVTEVSTELLMRVQYEPPD